MTSILWLRQDLRLHDNPALVAAATLGAVIPVYVLDDAAAGEKALGGAARWWLHNSLRALAQDFAAAGTPLILRRGDAVAQIMAIAAQTGASAVYGNYHYEPWWRAAEAALSAKIPLHLHHGNQLAPPQSILTGSGGRYKVFTPWWRALLAQMPPPKPVPAPEALTTKPGIESDVLDSWGLLPTRPNWATGFADWTPGEAGARAALKSFLPHIRAYDHDRNLPSQRASSRLSPHLQFGEISPATVWHIASKEAGEGAEPFLREIGWRDYAANLIDQMPDYPDRNGKAQFDKLQWRTGPDADADFAAWTRGQTGYPIVDAGMRELWQTGWMHNRVRMIAASFLVKHLLIDWRRGERWFWDTLLDASYAANASNWQWVAGTGVDAPLFSRIMAPLSQSEKFDASAYIRTYVPELAGLSAPYIHDPDEFGQRPQGYPAKRIGHREARERTLAAYQNTR
jgi:deoxyribodipyrimidine photo-lyase